MKRSPMKRGSGLRRGKPINRFGPIAQRRKERQVEWIDDHPPLEDSRGKYYRCHICIYFGESPEIARVPFELFVLEHIHPKGDLTLEESEEDDNLGPAHKFCNNEKGSQLLCNMKRSPISGLPNPNASR